MASAKVTSKGQITIPKGIRQALRLSAGDRVEFGAAVSGEIVMRTKSRSIRELYGALKRPGKRAVSVSAMDRAILSEHREASR